MGGEILKKKHPCIFLHIHHDLYLNMLTNMFPRYMQFYYLRIMMILLGEGGGGAILRKYTSMFNFSFVEGCIFLRITPPPNKKYGFWRSRKKTYLTSWVKVFFSRGSGGGGEWIFKKKIQPWFINFYIYSSNSYFKNSTGNAGNVS